jgi:hypothetical protein
MKGGGLETRHYSSLYPIISNPSRDKIQSVYNGLSMLYQESSPVKKTV